jgi:Sulfotransferase family
MKVRLPEETSVRPNVIVLTSGLTGSSVLTGLIARANYWTGAATHKKEYDTHENVRLIQLNKQLMHEAEYSGRYEYEFQQDVLDRIASLDPALNGAPYREFLQECAGQQPWIWKDPRLWLTKGYWNRLIDWKQCKVIVLTRNPRRSWVSMTLRRGIQSYAEVKQYESAIERSSLQFVNANKIDALRITFDELVIEPERSLDRLNGFLGTQLTLEDLKAVYHGELYRAPRGSLWDFLTAVLIYAKNRCEETLLRNR